MVSGPTLPLLMMPTMVLFVSGSNVAVLEVWVGVKPPAGVPPTAHPLPRARIIRKP